MVYITHIRQAKGKHGHTHITDVKWLNPTTAKVGESSVSTMVGWLKNKNGVAKVSDGRTTVNVGVMDASPPYLRTYADRVWTDNLLALPAF